MKFLLILLLRKEFSIEFTEGEFLKKEEVKQVMSTVFFACMWDKGKGFEISAGSFFKLFRYSKSRELVLENHKIQEQRQGFLNDQT